MVIYWPQLLCCFFFQQRGEVGVATIKTQAAIGREEKCTCSCSTPAAWEFRDSQQARASVAATSRTSLSTNRPAVLLSKPSTATELLRQTAAMKEQTRFILWLQLFTACLVFVVNGKLPLCVCLSYSSTRRRSSCWVGGWAVKWPTHSLSSLSPPEMYLLVPYTLFSLLCDGFTSACRWSPE